MRYVAAVRFPIRVSWRFIRDYPESARVTKAILKSFAVTYNLWRTAVSPKMTSDYDANGKIIWNVAGTEWVRRIEECGQIRILVAGDHKILRDQRYVVAANHTSTLDILAVAKAIPDGMFVVKSSIMKSRYPVISTALRKGGHIFVERGDTAQAREAINKGMERRPGTSPIFFVEGTRSPDGLIAQFKKGAFRVAIDHGLPILPLVISGSHRTLPKGTLMGLRRGSTIYVECLDPIETRGMKPEDLPGLTERTRKVMTEAYYAYDCNPCPHEGQQLASPRRPAIETHDERVLRPFI